MRQSQLANIIMMTGTIISTDMPISCCRCGKTLEVPPYLTDGKKGQCEACHLSEQLGTLDPTELIRQEAALAEALVIALDMREHETGLHSKRVACHTLELAKLAFPTDLGKLRQIYWGALLHDIGKISVPDAILLKKGDLTDAEWEVMKEHAEKGYLIVSKIPGMQAAAEQVWSHEERFDGSGYPRGLRGDQIPWGARLFAVIDTLDAITSDRPYRQGRSFDEAKKDIIEQSGKQFDPKAVRLFLASETVLRVMVEMKCDNTRRGQILSES
jgi:putative nucleotidyltransferase with HDIG domain